MRKRYFLIVDDSDSALYALKKCLKDFDAEIITAKDGYEGKKLAKANVFDLVITDVDMPGLNGLEFCRWLKMYPGTAKTPVIILSSLESDDDIDQGFRVGADAYVPKSCAALDLMPRIEQVLDATALKQERSILVADDSYAIRSILQEGLEEAGYNVILAQDGKEALDILEDTRPDLVLTDLSMPHLDGQGLCQTIKQRTDLCTIPVVFMSVTGDKAVMQRMIQEGAAAYVTKPFSVHNLNQLLEKIFSEEFHMMAAERDRLQAERRLTYGAIASLVRALEARDQYTRGHSKSVTRIAKGIAARLGFDRDRLTRLHIAGYLHDLGKIGIRDNVLLKPARLSDEEFEHIKQHTTLVADILDPIPGMSDVLTAASSHHERWDGTGYPKGLRGKNIPLFGRILAVADVYDAMTSDRVYRSALPREDVHDLIISKRGIKFCPECVDAFSDWYDTTRGIVGASSDILPDA